jgi:hypothetical protein
MESETDKKIQEAAKALSRALTQGGKDYYVHAHSVEVTRIDSATREFAWTVHVSETVTRDIAP